MVAVHVLPLLRHLAVRVLHLTRPPDRQCLVGVHRTLRWRLTPRVLSWPPLVVTTVLLLVPLHVLEDFA